MARRDIRHSSRAPAADTWLSFADLVLLRGILAPLLQWQPGAQATYDAVRIHIGENAYTYDGYFAKTASPFIHHPIPQAAWCPSPPL